MGWEKMAETLVCGFYYNFRDYHILSHLHTSATEIIFTTEATKFFTKYTKM